MKKVIVATRNKGKAREFGDLLSDLGVQVVTMTEAGVGGEAEEEGKTFEENALLKARYVYERTGELVVADDSGLEVDFLDGAPGIYSARFGGADATDTDRNNKLLGLLQGVPPERRTARFVSAVAVITSEGREYVVRAACEGLIGDAPRGEHGFGYDPLFFLPEYKKTMAQLESEIKNAVSHRGKALRLMLDRLRKELAAELG